MAEESALEHPAEIYNPFDRDEIERLATYKDDVERWTSMAFFTDPTRSLGPKKPGEERTIRLADVDDEATHAVMGIFRSLYTGTEPTSFKRTMNLLKSHLRPSPRRDEALHDLRAMQDWEKNEIERTPIKLVRGEQEFTPAVNIRAHLYGVYLHKDPGRRRELQVLPRRLHTRRDAGEDLRPSAGLLDRSQHRYANSGGILAFARGRWEHTAVVTTTCQESPPWPWGKWRSLGQFCEARGG